MSPEDRKLRLTDRQLRGALSFALSTHYAPDDTLVVHELPIAFGYTRMDVTVLNGKIDGYEIKSDRDRLNRLERQLVQYIPIYDRLTVVTTERHRDAVAATVPGWCGILVAGIVGDHVALFTDQEPTENPHWDVRSVLFLLWQTETRRLARKYGVSYSSVTPKGVTQDQLAKSVSPDMLRAEVIEILKHREWSETHIRA